MAWDRYKSDVVGFEVAAQLFGNFQSRAYCDHPSAGVYIAKPPVAKLKMTPAIQFPNTNITWDVSNSISPTGTIGTFTLRFGSTPTDLVNQPWTGPKTGTVQYDTKGVWQASLVVRDLLNVDSQPAVQTIKIIDRPEGMIYVGTTDQGPFRISPIQVEQITAGLTGDWLKLRTLRVHPASRANGVGLHFLWLASPAGVAHSLNSGGSWNLITNATLGDAITGEPTAQLDNVDVAFNPLNNDEINVLRHHTASGGYWIYYSYDYGLTWDNQKVTV